MKSSKNISKFELALFLGLIISVIITCFMPFYSECKSLQNDVLRLHIPANSDSVEDQQIKLMVRDAILNEAGYLFENTANLNEAKKQAEKNLDIFKNIAERVLAENNVNQTVKVSIEENTFVDTRTYDKLIMPSGRFTALKIELGSGKGKNWWCVMYPPMCVDCCSMKSTDITNKLLSLKDYPNYKMAFASVEIFERFLNIINTPSYKLIK